MPRYALLLRGINVGGHGRLPMAELRNLLSGLGYTDARTLLQSGNAVFATAAAPPAALAAAIEAAVAARLGLAVRCLVRDRDEFRAVVAGNPFTAVATDGSKLVALFLSEAPVPGLLAANDPTDLAPETIRLGERVIYQWCPDGILAAPPVGAYVERRLGVAVTARNWNTVVKLCTLLDA